MNIETLNEANGLLSRIQELQQHRALVRGILTASTDKAHKLYCGNSQVTLWSSFVPGTFFNDYMQAIDAEIQFLNEKFSKL